MRQWGGVRLLSSFQLGTPSTVVELGLGVARSERRLVKLHSIETHSRKRWRGGGDSSPVSLLAHAFRHIRIQSTQSTPFITTTQRRRLRSKLTTSSRLVPADSRSRIHARGSPRQPPPPPPPSLDSVYSSPPVRITRTQGSSYKSRSNTLRLPPSDRAPFPLPGLLPSLRALFHPPPRRLSSAPTLVPA